MWVCVCFHVTSVLWRGDMGSNMMQFFTISITPMWQTQKPLIQNSTAKRCVIYCLFTSSSEFRSSTCLSGVVGHPYTLIILGSVLTQEEFSTYVQNHITSRQFQRIPPKVPCITTMRCLYFDPGALFSLHKYVLSHSLTRCWVSHSLHASTALQSWQWQHTYETYFTTCLMCTSSLSNYSVNLTTGLLLLFSQPTELNIINCKSCDIT